jgi:hypothetical protein
MLLQLMREGYSAEQLDDLLNRRSGLAGLSGRGNDLRDIEAGRSAGMLTVAAAYGFCGEDSPPRSWGADALIEHPAELQALLRLAR